ncbi:MAG: hypothetical protein LC658_07425 [Bacteroidales bacterium]|nr:hypothetical protein [Bacteroidales bacterium]
MNFKKYILTAFITGIVIIGGLVLFAFARTWGKTEIQFKIHINEELVQQSTFGESPTFAIWIEEHGTKETQTVFVTNRAGLGDWEGKADVPDALPKWFAINKAQNSTLESTQQENTETDAITGATPQPGYFTTRVSVSPGSRWNCYIEVNLAGDFNEHYRVYNAELKTSDEYMTGQPALLYKAEITVEEGNTAMPEIIGMSVLDSEDGNLIKPLEGITTAIDIFDEIEISVARPKPRIIVKN